MYHNIIKATYDKPIANIILNEETILKPFPLNSRARQVPTLPTPIQHILGIPSQSNEARRRNKKNKNK
jgi:hypothetical protein